MNRKFSEQTYVNHVAVMGHTIVGVVLAAAYAIEVVKGSREPWYYAIFVLLCLGPVIAEHIVYKKHPESAMIRHIICIAYGILYLFVIFTTTSVAPFAYAFPMFMVIILYMDMRMCIIIGIGATAGNIAQVAYHALTVGYDSLEIPDIEIRIAATAITSFFMVYATIALKKVNGEKMGQIERKTEEATILSDTVLQISGGMISGIGEVSDKVSQLGESMERIHSYMGEVSTGSTETAESIQQQMIKTEQIQQQIVRVKNAAEGIEENMKETSQKIDEGKEQMAALSEQMEKSMNANSQVLEQMKALSEYTSQMNTIIETITSIANSTGMLALNASIEAARAGEAGRGFAVVANQISGLASQTKSATVNITELIEHINRELESVETAVDVVTESNMSNEESTQRVTESFKGIANGTESVGGQTQELMSIVDELEKANREIVESIQTISAITEEVSAHASETYNACEDNGLLLESATNVVQSLNRDAEKLQACKS